MGKKGYILSGAALLAALTLLAGCGKNNDTDDKNKDKPDTDPAQEIVLVQPEAADVRWTSRRRRRRGPMPTPI